jgi:hypothetical protein
MVTARITQLKKELDAIATANAVSNDFSIYN